MARPRVHQRTSGGGVLSLWGEYDDDLVLTSDGWRVRVRRYSTWLSEGDKSMVQPLLYGGERDADARIRELEDEREIRELLSRYVFYADSMRDDDYVGLWTDDGAMDLSMGSSHDAYDGVVRFEGRDELRAFIGDPAAHHAPGFYGHSMHVHGNNLVVRIDGDDAVASAYSILLQQQGAGIGFVGAGTNRWLFRRVAGRWRIRERRRREVGHPDTAANLADTD